MSDVTEEEYYERKRREAMHTLSTLGRSEIPAIDSAFCDIIHELLAEMGGIVGFVRNFLLDYNSLQPGDKNRIKMTTDILKLIQQFDGKTPEHVDPEQLAAVERLMDSVRQPSAN